MDNTDLMILDLTWYWQMDAPTHIHTLIKPLHKQRSHGALAL